MPLKELKPSDIVDDMLKLSVELLDDDRLNYHQKFHLSALYTIAAGVFAIVAIIDEGHKK